MTGLSLAYYRNLIFLCALACGALACGALACGALACGTQACGALAAALGPLACFYLTAVIGAHKTDRITNESKTG